MAVETALISAPSRGGNRIFGRYLLERLMLACEREGVRRFFVQAPAHRRSDVQSSLGSFRSRPEVTLVDGFEALDHGLDPATPCISLAGNLVFSKRQLKRVLADANETPSQVLRFSSSDPDHGGEIAVGPVSQLLEQGGMRTEPVHRPTEELPFALNGRPEDRDEAELRLARALRHETADKDAALARLIDRKISWRVSLRLARTRITPNQVTIANTCLGLACAAMFAIPGYGWRLLASLLFLASITIDGIDGELARLQMSETDWGGRLDVITDNIVHVAIFIGVFIGVYRASANSIFLWLLPIQLGGFAFTATSIYLAFRYQGPRAEQWIDQVDRWSGRDFAYLLFGFALLNRLDWFCWGTAFGTYVFGIVLIWLTVRRGRIEPGTEPLREDAGAAVEEA
ncbi:MAG TPA: CDP-alcohol phosphatidyltransferase family protein [Candidatus Binataceae bacterium]|nr:CDP-alcohol phosphatidyltransferase family protein [Candidatus Binataceae bacterium]